MARRRGRSGGICRSRGSTWRSLIRLRGRLLRGGIEGRLVFSVALDRAQTRYVLLMLVVSFREDMAAGAVGDKIELAGPRRIGGGFE